MIHSCEQQPRYGMRKRPSFNAGGRTSDLSPPPIKKSKPGRPAQRKVSPKPLLPSISDRRLPGRPKMKKPPTSPQFTPTMKQIPPSHPPRSSYAGWITVRLKEELRSRKLKISGSSAVEINDDTTNNK